jgi:hypothetical protein
MEVEMTMTTDATKSIPKRMSNERPANHRKVTRGVMVEEDEVDQDHRLTKTMMMTATSCPPGVEPVHVMWSQVTPLHPCSNKERRKQELNMFKLPPLPKKADELEDFQVNIETSIMVASGRHHRRLQWIIATTLAKHPDELSRVPRKLMSLDLKQSVACLIVCCNRNYLSEILRRAGGEIRNDSDMCNGRRCLWRIYEYFASPSAGSTDHGLRVAYSVLDLGLIQLYGEDAGLERFWNKWAKTMSKITDGGGHRSIFEHLFVNQMRNAPLMTACVLEYDEADVGTEKHTWEWLLKKGRVSKQNNSRQPRNLESGCVWSGEYLVAHTKEFRDMNYHAGRRKGDNKIVKIQ